MMKKISAVACVLLALSLAGCGTTAPVVSSSDTDSTLPETTTAQPAETEETLDPAITVSPDAPVVDGFSYADLEDLTFSFSSGVGAWQTTLYIAPNGSFSGEFYDSDMGDTDDGYPNGTVYVCTFSGKLASLSQLGDLTYTTTIESLDYDNAVDAEEIRDGIRYIYTTAYGLDGAEALYFYLPGTETAELDEGCMDWLHMYLSDYGEDALNGELPFVVLYNESAETAFVGEIAG